MELREGISLGPYELVAPLGAGGMGEIWSARDPRVGRAVAIKVLAQDLSSSAAARQRFQREARSITALAHPNICALHAVGEQDGELFLVMEQLMGETLAERLKRGPMPAGEAVTIGIEIAAALSAAHAANIVHRDLKPGNVMLTPTGVKLLDFGLAKVIDAAAGPSAETVEKPISGPGVIAGTMAYMSPEQLAGESVDARSDIYSLGCVMVEMLTARRYVGADVGPIGPPALERLIRSCLSKERNQRWQSASDLATTLRWMASEWSEAPTRPRRWLWIAAIAALLIAVGAYFLSPR